MNITDSDGGDIGGFAIEEVVKPKAFPDDLPRSLNDRRSVPEYTAPETEMYDAWQGMGYCLH
jgi:hypothetical protein